MNEWWDYLLFPWMTRLFTLCYTECILFPPLWFLWSFVFVSLLREFPTPLIFSLNTSVYKNSTSSIPSPNTAFSTKLPPSLQMWLMSPFSLLFFFFWPCLKLQIHFDLFALQLLLNRFCPLLHFHPSIAFVVSCSTFVSYCYLFLLYFTSFHSH